MPLYRYIRFTGPISVNQWNGVLTPHDSAMVILVMGPSGAGKSHFIQTLGGGARVANTDSSKEFLEGHTQSVSAFKLKNVEYADCGDEDDQDPWDIYIVDTPGLSSCDLSVMEIIENLRMWMNSHGVNAIFRAMYFCSIISPGLSRRDRLAVETFKWITGQDWAESILVVTTKWDLVQGKEEQLRAERNFETFRNDVWEDWIERGGLITKYLDTQNSALEILDSILSARAGSYYHIEQMVDKDMQIRDTPFGPHVHRDLLDRVKSLRHQLQLLEAVEAQRFEEINTEAFRWFFRNSHRVWH